VTPELKQRLVGAAVLLFLAGLLWLLLFDFDASEREVSPSVAIPPMPTIEAVVVEPATPFYNDKANDSTSNSSVEADGVNEQASSSELSELLGDSPDPKPIANKTHYVDHASRPRLDEQGVPVAYVVQLGSFKRFDNANKLRDKLVNGYQFKAYLEPRVEMSEGPYKVLVGPVLTYADAKSLAVELKNKAEITSTMIKRFGDIQ
jgi:DedD protein